MRGYKSILFSLLFLAFNAFGLTPNENTTNIANAVKANTAQYPVVGGTNVVFGYTNRSNNGTFTNYFVDTNTVYVGTAGSNIVTQTYGWHDPLHCWTNPVNSIRFARTGGRYALTNAIGGVGTDYYRLVASFILSFSAPGQMTNTSSIGSVPCPVALWGTNIIIITNKATGYQTAFPVNEFLYRQSYLSTLGNDTNFLRGSRQNPAATLNYVCTNLMSGDVLKIDAGSYFVSNAVFPANVSLIGEGENCTFITVQSAGASTPGVTVSGNYQVSGITFQTTNQATAANGQLPLVLSGSGNILNMNIVGDADGFNGPGGSNSTNIFKNCSINSAFDTFVTASGTNILYELFDCKLVSRAGLNGSLFAVNNHGIECIAGSGAILNMYGGSIVAQNGNTETYGIHAQPASTNQINLYSVSVVAVSTNGVVAPSTNATTAFIKFIPPTIQSGRTNIAALATSLVIQFATPMPSTNYTPKVTSSAAQTAESYSAIAVNSFTYNCASAAASSLTWTVTENSQ